MYIVLGEHERSIGLEEKPLRLYKNLKKEGKKSSYILRYMASSEPKTSPGSLTELNSKRNTDLGNPISEALFAQTFADSEAPKDSSPTASSVTTFKLFRVGLNDPCYKVLPAALRKHNIQADWCQYCLFIIYGDQERRVQLEEKPLAILKDLDRQGKEPTIMLKRLNSL